MQKVSKDLETLMLKLVAAFPNSQATPETVTVYAEVLSDIPIQELRIVVNQVLAESKFLPAIAELREMHRKLGNVAKLTWADAWELVQKEIRRVGSYQLPKIDDETTARVVKAMGWRSLCASEEPEIMRAQFRQMYEAISNRQDGLDKLLPQSRRLAAEKSGMLPIRKLLEGLQ